MDGRYLLPSLYFFQFGRVALALSGNAELALFFCLVVLRGNRDPDSRRLSFALNLWRHFNGPVTERRFLQWLDAHPKSQADVRDMMPDYDRVLTAIEKFTAGVE